MKLKRKCTTTISRLGKHFIECKWSKCDANFPAGFEWCVCSNVNHLLQKFISLLVTLGSDECGEELYNSILNTLQDVKEVHTQ